MLSLKRELKWRAIRVPAVSNRATLHLSCNSFFRNFAFQEERESIMRE